MNPCYAGTRCKISVKQVMLSKMSTQKWTNVQYDNCSPKMVLIEAVKNKFILWILSVLPKSSQNGGYCLVLTQMSESSEPVNFIEKLDRNVFSVKLSRICWLNGAKRCKCALILHLL